MKRAAPTTTHAFAACTFEIQADGAAIQLLPAGPFKARDGRPADVKAGHWVINGQVAAKLIAKAATRATDVVVDFEHQTLNSEKNGQPAPAAGWLKGAALEWRDGQGLFATNPEWVGDTADLIKTRKYRYLSPVFSYDRATGEVLELHHVGLTNYPAIDGMADLAALAAARFQLAAPAAPAVEEKPCVNREQLIALLGLSSDASDDDIQNALTALKDGQEKVQELTTQLAAAKAATPAVDPEKFVSVDVVEQLKRDFAALRTEQNAGKVDELVKTGLSDGRLLPAQEQWARDLGAKDVAALKTYLDTTPAIAALKHRQTEARPATPEKVEELSPETLAVCKQLNVSAEDYIATLKGEPQ